jgi:hypothetical protein
MAVTMPTETQAAPPDAAQLAARIPIPLRLPPRYDGQPLSHLSKSSVELFCRCPDAYRRRYVLGVGEPAGAVMFLGSRVDDALTHYYRTLLDSGETLPPEELESFYTANWQQQLELEQEQRGVDWSELDAEVAMTIGREALGVCLQKLVPQLGEPVAVQRKLEFRLHPRAEWTVVGFIDLETRREQPGQERPVAEVVDWKVKADAVHQQRADRDLQAGLYLAGRWIEGDPADSFAFAQALRPGARRKHVSTALTRTTRSVGELRAIRARLALVASQIAWLYERYGPDRPWGFADPTSWACSERYCPHWQTCPGGQGL